MHKTTEQLKSALLELIEQFNEGLMAEDEFRNKLILEVDLFRPEFDTEESRIAGDVP